MIHLINPSMLEREVKKHFEGNEYSQWFIPFDLRGIVLASSNQINDLLKDKTGNKIFTEKVNGMTLYAWKENKDSLVQRYLGYKCDTCGNNVLGPPIIISMDEFNNDYFCINCETSLNYTYELIN